VKRRIDYTFFVEIGFGMLFLIFSLILKYRNYEGFSTWLLTILSVLVPATVGWIRYHINQVLSESKSHNEIHNTMTQFFLAIINSNGSRAYTSKLSDKFIKSIEAATETLQKSHVRAHYFKDEINKRLAKGFYIVANPSAIFKHNTSFLESLKKGDEFKTMHFYDIHKNLINCAGLEETVEYKNLIKAQKESSKRGVIVTRLYIFDEFTKIPQVYKNQMDDLDAANVDIRILLRRQFDSGTDYSDITIIGKIMAGIMEDKNHLSKCTYYVNNDDNIQEYIDEFNQLANAAKNLAEVKTQIDW